MASECGLADVRIEYSRQGRVPLTGVHFPSLVSRWFPRAFSDNLFLMARSPRDV